MHLYLGSLSGYLGSSSHWVHQSSPVRCAQLSSAATARPASAAAAASASSAAAAREARMSRAAGRRMLQRGSGCADGPVAARHRGQRVAGQADAGVGVWRSMRQARVKAASCTALCPLHCLLPDRPHASLQVRASKLPGLRHTITADAGGRRARKRAATLRCPPTPIAVPPLPIPVDC